MTGWLLSLQLSADKEAPWSVLIHRQRYHQVGVRQGGTASYSTVLGAETFYYMQLVIVYAISFGCCYNQWGLVLLSERYLKVFLCSSLWE